VIYIALEATNESRHTIQPRSPYKAH